MWGILASIQDYYGIENWNSASGVVSGIIVGIVRYSGSPH